MKCHICEKEIEKDVIIKMSSRDKNLELIFCNRCGCHMIDLFLDISSRIKDSYKAGLIN